MPRILHFKKLDIPYQLAVQLKIANQCVGGPFVTYRKNTDHEIGCRVPRNLQTGGDWIFNHLIKFWKYGLQGLWSKTGARLRVSVYDGAKASGSPTRATWKVPLNHRVHSRAMYKASFYKPNPIYSGTHIAVAGHEFGHWLGLDDEYGGCKGSKGAAYAMCNSFANSKTRYKAIYTWIITRRYATAMN